MKTEQIGPEIHLTKTQVLVNTVTGIEDRLESAIKLLSCITSLSAVPTLDLTLDGAAAQVLEIIVRNVDHVFASSVLLHDNRADVLRLLAARGQSDLVGERPGSYNHDLTFKPGEGLAGKVFAGQKPLFYDRDADLSDVLKQEGCTAIPDSLACLPLALSDRVIGVLNLSFAVPRPFDHSRRRNLILLGQVVANVLQTFMLRSEVDEKARQLELRIEERDKEIAERSRLEEALIIARDGLEIRVKERTAELSSANDQLRMEIRERHLAEAALHEEKEFIKAILQNSFDGIAVVSRNGAVKFLSPGMERLFGYSASDIDSLDRWAALIVPDEHDRRRILLKWEENMSHLPRPETIFTFTHSNGESRWCRFQVSPMPGGDVVINGQDITEIKRAETRIRHLALHDPLTELPNRQLLWDRLEQSLMKAKRHDMCVGLLYMDLDGFKAVNDTHGHDAGDDVLRIVAKRLAASVRGIDTAARVGGDEFVVVLPGLSEIGEAVKIAVRILENFGQPIIVNQAVMDVGASIGIASYPIHCKGQDELLLVADKAMYQAKRAGGKQFRIAEMPPNG